MKFQEFHKDFFNATKGAYSRVTNRENFDSQITLTDIETEIVQNYFGKDAIHIGNVTSDQKLSRKDFLLFPNFNRITLNLVYPKQKKTELRLYLSSKSGFKPQGDEIWFIFIDLNQQLVIGSMHEHSWRSLGQNDPEDSEYQESIISIAKDSSSIDIDPKGKIVSRIIESTTVYARNPRIAAMRFDLTSYKCEINKDHKTFIGLRTGRQYIEAHHFIPMKFQAIFETPLDNLENVIALCPNCHRGIHHAVIDHKLGLIKTIYEKRPSLHNLSFEYIAQFYNSLKIIDRH